MPPSSQPAAIRLFCSYAPEDERFRMAFEKALASLRRAGLVDLWSRAHLLAGMNVRASVTAALDSASVIVALVSNAFISSDECWSYELDRAMKRLERREARLVPVLVSPCLLEGTALAALKPLPTGERPVTSWPSEDEAWASVASGLNEIIKAVQIEALQRVVPSSMSDKPSERDAATIRTMSHGLSLLAETQPAVAFSPGELLTLGDARFVSGETSEAILLYRKAIAAAPESAAGWYKLAFALDEGYQQHEEALRFYNVALALDAAMVEAHVDRSYVLRNLSRFAESIDAAATALRLDPSNARAAYNLACSHACAGHEQEALASLETAITLNPARYRRMAARDRDFAAICRAARFLALVDAR